MARTRIRSDGRGRGTRAAWAALGLLLALTLAPRAVVAQTGAAAARLVVAPVILAEPAQSAPVPVEVIASAPLPRNCYVRIKGVPADAALSEGHMVTPGTWAVPVAGLASLSITAQQALAGKVELTLALLTIDGAVLAEGRSALLVATLSLVPPAAAAPAAPVAALVSPASPPPAAPPVAAPVPSAPPAAAKALPPPEMKPEQRERAVKLLQRGDAEMAAGDIAAARLFYQRAAEAGLADAAMAMAATFDPGELARRPVRGLAPDPAEARKWYTRAEALGATRAAEQLRRLAGQ